MRAVLATAFAFSVCLATVSHAGILIATGYANGSQSFGLSMGGTVSAGGFVGTWDGDPIQFWCAELDQTFAFNHSYTYTSSIPNNATYTMLGQLFHEAYAVALSDAQHSAAFQLAIWEILFDADLDLLAGGFRVLDHKGHGGTVTLAQGWLDNLGSYTDTFDIALLHNADHQDFITGQPPHRETVPEPAPLALIGAALLALIIAPRRRATGVSAL